MGFTLIELLITIIVISALAAVIITVLNPFVQLQKARDSGRKSDLAQIQRALEIYNNDNNSYPGALNFGASWTPYMSTVPQDPTAGRNYVYDRPDGQTYRLYASLERGGNDAQACFPATGAVCANAGALSCGAGVICNYGVTSTNTSP